MRLSPQVVFEPEPALPLVHLSVHLHTGAASEDPAGREGLTRALIRLMRRTGGGLSPEELDTKIDLLGSSLWVEVGQSTIAFQATLLERSLDRFIGLLEDVLARPGLSDQEHARLVRETKSELIEVRDHDRSLCRRWFGRSLYPNHPYGRPTSGTLASIEGLTTSDARALHQNLFRRDNMVLGFAGDITEARARALADRLLQALPPGERRRDTVPAPSVIPGRRLIVVDKPERTQTQILIGGLGTHPQDDDHMALYVGNTIFGGTFTARLTQEVRSKRGWSYGAYSSLPFDRQRRSFSMWTFPKATDAAPCIRLQLELLEQWIEEGVTSEELAWAQGYLVRSFAFSVDSAGKRAEQELDAQLFGLPEGYYERYRERVAAVTVEEVNAAIRRRISAENLLVTVVGTESEIGSGVREAIGELSASEVIPYTREEL